MDLNFYSDLSDGCAQNVDSEFLDPQAYGEYPVENKFAGGGDGYLSIGGAAHPFLSAEQTFHTPSLGDEVFEIPPISLDPDPALSIGEAVSHYDSGGPSLVVGAGDPSFAAAFVNSGPQGLEQLSLGAMPQAGGGALLSSSALELGSAGASHFSTSSPMTIDVQLGDMAHGLLGSAQLSTINPAELALGLGGGGLAPRPEAPEQPLSATPSPAGSLQDEDVDDFKRSVLVDSPLSLSSPSSAVLSHISSHAAPRTVSLATARKGGGKPATLVTLTEAAGAKKGRKKKDPNEPQKPVSAYALFFRDTQAAIKGQNPNASFGEVSKIVASMWDSLAEDQKQVYKRKTEAAKREYLKALAAYKANQLSQPVCEEMDAAPSPPPAVPTPAVPTPAPAAGHLPPRPAPASSRPEENTITNICASNIILDVPEMITRSHTGAGRAPPPGAAPAQTITKIIIPKHMLQAGGQVVTVLPGGVHALQSALLVSSRQPPPLQQMQGAPPPPPRLQQMAPAPPPLQAKPREGGGAPGHPPPQAAAAATPPPPLQIKIVPAPIQDKKAAPIMVAAQPAAAYQEEDEVTEVLHSEEEEMEVNGLGSAGGRSVCVRAGCNNPAVDSQDWDKEYCSNECVATHCRDVFQAWCSIRNQSLGTVK